MKNENRKVLGKVEKMKDQKAFKSTIEDTFKAAFNTKEVREAFESFVTERCPKT